jgi:hypothetical protein
MFSLVLSFWLQGVYVLRVIVVQPIKKFVTLYGSQSLLRVFMESLLLILPGATWFSVFSSNISVSSTLISSYSLHDGMW